MQTLIEFLVQGGQVVTANNRLARDLRQRVHHHQQARGLSVWETPRVLAWGSWVRQAWNHGSAQGETCLNTHQERWLWEDIIASSEYADRLYMRGAAARSCQQAWQLIHQYRLPFPFPAQENNEDARAFLIWAQAYQKRCKQSHWLDEACLPDRLATMLDTLGDELPAELMLAGFIDFTPQQTALLDALKASGVRIDEHCLPASTPQIHCESHRDQEAEIQAAAHWAREKLQSEPEGRYAIVFPQLQDVQSRVEAVFDDVLQAGTWQVGAHHQPRVYHISAGKPLPDYSLIHDALALLELEIGEFSLPAISALLHSAFIRGHIEERHARAQLDASLREHGALRLSLGDMNWIARGRRSAEDAEPVCPRFLEVLANWQAERRALPEKQGVLDHVEAFTRLLESAGWPGEQGLDSVQYQVMQAWRDALDSFISLGLVTPACSFPRAVGLLRKLVESQVFQPASQNPPILISGILEACGEQYDAMRVVGLHDEVWPPMRAPNPFIPVGLQRQFAIPDSSPQRQTAYAVKLTRALLGAASDVCLSYPRQDGDRELRISPLIASYPQTDSDIAARAYADWPDILRATLHMEPLADLTGPALIAGEKQGGGTALFKDQAACPFRAYATHRLGARPIAAISNGLDAMQRGSLVHACLERFWAQVHDQQTFLEMTADALDACIESVCAEVVQEHAQTDRTTYSQRFAQLEQNRLQGLLREWLEMERQRSPFEVIAVEQRQAVEIAGFSVNTFIDRIDRLDNGEVVVIDYKTGRPRSRDWFGERPAEPQLPVYAVTMPQALAAVAFAQVRRGDMKWIGVAAEDGTLPSVRGGVPDLEDGPQSYEALKSYWQAVLEKLADDYRQGHAEVDPREASTCNWCALGSLCRISAEEQDDE